MVWEISGKYIIYNSNKAIRHLKISNKIPVIIYGENRTLLNDIKEDLNK